MKIIPKERSINLVEWYSKLYIIALSLVLIMLGDVPNGIYDILDGILAGLFSIGAVALIAFAVLKET